MPRNADKTSCLRGHPFDAENTYVRSNGQRGCKACTRLRSLRRPRKMRPLSPPRRSRRPADERFFARVLMTSECWIWIGGRTKLGYGKFALATGLRGGKSVSAHRFAFEQLVRPLGDDEHLHHTCRNRACVRPEHIEVLDHAAHMALHAAERSGCVRP